MVLVILPQEPTGPLHPLCACKKFIYWSLCYTLRDCFLPPPCLLPYQPETCGLQCCVHPVPLPIPAVALLFCHPHNPSRNPVMKHLYHRNHFICQHPALSPIQEHCLGYLCIHHCLRFDWCPCIPHNLCHHTPSPLGFPQVAVEFRPVTSIVRDCAP